MRSLGEAALEAIASATRATLHTLSAIGIASPIERELMLGDERSLRERLLLRNADYNDFTGAMKFVPVIANAVSFADTTRYCSRHAYECWFPQHGGPAEP